MNILAAAAQHGSVGAILSMLCGLIIVLIIFGKWNRPR